MNSGSLPFGRHGTSRMAMNEALVSLLLPSWIESNTKLEFAGMVRPLTAVAQRRAARTTETKIRIENIDPSIFVFFLLTYRP